MRPRKVFTDEFLDNVERALFAGLAMLAALLFLYHVIY